MSTKNETTTRGLTSYPHVRAYLCDAPDGKTQVLETMAANFDLEFECPCGGVLQITLTSGWSAKRGLFVDLKEPVKWKKGP